MPKDNLTTASILQYSNRKYKKRLFDWLFLRDALEGESAIKFKNELYLPMPTSMADFQPPAVSQQARNSYYSQFWGDDYLRTLFTEYNPNFHRNAAYSAYISRAEFPELPGYVLRGLIGLAFKKLPTINLPSDLEYLRRKATQQGATLLEYYGNLLQENLSHGRVITTFDISNDDNVYFTMYKAEDCINWQYDNSLGEDRRLSAIRLVETEDDSFDEPDNSLNDQDVVIIEMRMIGDTYYVRKLYSDQDMTSEWIIEDENNNLVINTDRVIQPNVSGQSLDYIPAIAIGSLNNEFDIDPAPLYPIANSARQIYMKSADLSQSEYMSCSPMLVMTGVSSDNAPSSIGSTVAIAIPNPDAKVFFTETDTSALSHVKDHIKELHTKAINMGAQLLDTSPKPAETAETTRLKQSASTATLLTSVRNTANALEKQLKQIASLKGANPDEVSVIPNVEFIAPMITAAEIRELVQSWVNGALSKTTLLGNFKRAGIIDEAKTIEDELSEIEKEEDELAPGSVKYNRMKALFEGNRGNLGKGREETLPNDEPITASVGDE